MAFPKKPPPPVTRTRLSIKCLIFNSVIFFWQCSLRFQIGLKAGTLGCLEAALSYPRGNSLESLDPWPLESSGKIVRNFD